MGKFTEKYWFDMLSEGPVTLRENIEQNTTTYMRPGSLHSDKQRSQRLTHKDLSGEDLNLLLLTG